MSHRMDCHPVTRRWLLTHRVYGLAASWSVNPSRSNTQEDDVVRVSPSTHPHHVTVAAACRAAQPTLGRLPRPEAGSADR